MLNTIHQSETPTMRETILVGSLEDWAMALVLDELQPSFSNPETHIQFRIELSSMIIFAKSVTQEYMICGRLVYCRMQENENMWEGTFQLSIIDKDLLERLLSLKGDDGNSNENNPIALNNEEGETLH